MSKYGTEKKQICFESVTKLHADLKIKLHYDDLKIREFFNEVIKAYTEENEYFINFIEELKKQKGISKTKRNKIKRNRIKAREIEKKFSLEESEIEDIFDIIEKEWDV